MLIIISAVYLLKQVGVLHQSHSEALGAFLVNLVLPSVVFTSLATIQLEIALIALPLSAIGGQVIFTLVSWAVSSRISSDSWKQLVRISFPTLEGGSIGLALMAAVFATAGAATFLMFDTANALYLFTAVLIISNSFKKGENSRKEMIEKIAKNPVLWSMVAGLLFNISGLTIPELGTTVLSFLSACLVGIAMAIIGLNIEFQSQSLIKSSVLVLAKMALGLALGMLAVSIFGATGIIRTSILLGLSLPPSLIIIPYAQGTGMDMSDVSNTVTMGFVWWFGIITLTPILQYFTG